MTYLVNGQSFRTKVVLRDYVRGILNNTVALVPDHHLPFLIDLFRRHQDAEEKFGAGIAAIRVRLALPYKTRCFEIERVDGSRTDISYLECITPSGPRDWFPLGCRTAVVDQIRTCKEVAFAHSDVIPCPVSGEPITYGTCHVDHAPPATFDRIVRDFISEEGLKVDRVKYLDGDGNTEYRFAERELEEAFALYHSKRAQLRVVSRRANLSLIKRTVR
jgi:hypothetical protein